MISLFALIMALGIIVDDAIVVGEDALTHSRPAGLAGSGGGRAAHAGSGDVVVADDDRRFHPAIRDLRLHRQIPWDIPFVIVCVIIASLIEAS